MSYNYDYITINGHQIRRPDNFTPAREDIYAGEYTTCTGATIADRIGWKYSDMDLTWSALQNDDVEVLLNIAGAVQLIFDDAAGDAIEETIIRTSAVALRHRFHDSNGYWWRDVSCSIRFIGSHTD